MHAGFPNSDMFQTTRPPQLFILAQTPSSEAYRHSGSKDIPRILCNSKLHRRIHVRAPAVLVLSHILLHTAYTHTLSCYFLINSRARQPYYRCLQSQEMKFRKGITLILIRNADISAELITFHPHFTYKRAQYTSTCN